MKCKWKDCNNESRTRSEFCSDTCSKRSRRNPDKPGQVSDLANPDSKPGQNTEPAPTTQNTDAQDAPGSTKSDEADDDNLDSDWTGEDLAEISISIVEFAKESQAKPVRTRVGGCKCSIPGDEDYDGCVTQQMIDDSHKARPQPAQAAPVDAGQERA